MDEKSSYRRLEIDVTYYNRLLRKDLDQEDDILSAFIKQVGILITQYPYLFILCPWEWLL